MEVLSKHQIEYTRAGINDVQVLVDYRMKFLIEFWDNQPDEAIRELKNYLHAFFTRSVNDNSYVSYLAKADGEVMSIGGMMFREQPGNFKNPSGKVGYIMNMYTFPGFRRKGIGSSILKKLIEEGEERGLTTFELHATKDGEQVYPKLGFKIHNQPTYKRYLVSESAR